MIYANIAGPEDIPQLLGSGADGVGLFRSEFLFLGIEAAPSEEEQYQAYRSVLEAMEDKEVIIRTMDLGSDKRVGWLAMYRCPVNVMRMTEQSVLWRRRHTSSSIKCKHFYKQKVVDFLSKSTTLTI